MNKKYLIPIVLLVGLGLVLAMLPPKTAKEGMHPEELLSQVTSSSRFVNPDVVADRLIKKDPSMVLVDVRSVEEFKDYSLPGALNIPLQDILLPEQIELISQEGIEYIFFSNGDILADQAWILSKRNGLENIFVMEGGLNEWFDSFFLLQPPPETASNEEIDRYQFRLGVKQFFTGGELEAAPKTAVENISVTPKKKKSAVEGGC